MKPGVVLASCASSPGPIKGDRSESSATCHHCSRTYSQGGQCFHRTRSYWCAKVHFPELALASLLIFPRSVSQPTKSFARQTVSSWVYVFGDVFFFAVKSNSPPIAVTDRERTLTTSAFSSSSSFSVSSASFSWSSLYRAWRSGDLTTSLLREFSRCERVSTYCSSGPQSDLWRSFSLRSFHVCLSSTLVRFFDDDGIYEDIDWWRSWDEV